jgi:hypothetical protein
VAAIEHHSVVQQAAIRLLDFLEIPKQLAQQFYLRDFDLSSSPNFTSSLP